jgi:hypothetical protein
MDKLTDPEATGALIEQYQNIEMLADEIAEEYIKKAGWTRAYIESISFESTYFLEPDTATFECHYSDTCYGDTTYDSFKLPYRLLFMDPEERQAEYDRIIAEKKAAKLAAQSLREETVAAQREARELAEYERLQAKFGGAQ